MCDWSSYVCSSDLTQRSAHPICTRSTEISARNQSVHFVFVQLGHGSFRLDNQKETIFAFSYSISLGACTCRARRRHAGLCKRRSFAKARRSLSAQAGSVRSEGRRDRQWVV